ncbi:hypothetical protein ACIHCQ_07795 [Streptomyces sp. NPDC052236]|uniref:hypothetical protein n=1 Tax=Streptomyces sp. NPDC052236 TaxID=3365686 RepID=UPI0037CFE93F
MNLAVRRLCAVAVLLIGITLFFWIVFGAPHEWKGGLRLLRLTLGMSAVGLISGSALLMFPSTPGEDGEDGEDGDPAAGRSGALADGPLDV